jgi:hypothetical protein
MAIHSLTPTLRACIDVDRSTRIALVRLTSMGVEWARTDAALEEDFLSLDVERPAFPVFPSER